MSSPIERTGAWHRAFVLLLLTAFAAPLAALENDRDQPIHITADQALRDEKKGFTVYRGNVRMNQGSLHIEADSITIYHVREDADKIVATGRPARLQQRPDPAKGPVHASAGVIEYYKVEERVHLRDEAYIEQDGSTVTGETIDYYIAEQRVKADSDHAEEGSRVEVVIPATQLQREEDERGATDSE